MPKEIEKKDVCNLYVKGLSNNCTQIDLDDLFKSFGIIQQSRIYDKGVGFVRFKYSEDAAKAKKALNNTYPKHNGCKGRLIVKYAFQKINVNDDNNNNNLNNDNNTTHLNQNNIFLRGIPPNLPTKELRELCKKFGKINHMYIHYNRNSDKFKTAFIRYKNIESADKAIQNLNKYKFKNEPNYTSFAKLANYDIKNKKKNKHKNDKESTIDSFSSKSTTSTPTPTPVPVPTPISSFNLSLSLSEFSNPSLINYSQPYIFDGQTPTVQQIFQMANEIRSNSNFNFSNFNINHHINNI